MPSQELRQLDEMTAAWRQAKEAFEESERRYRNLVEDSLGLICSHDLEGRLLTINPAAARSLGYEPEHGVGLSLATFLAPETRHLFDDYLQRIRDLGHDAGLMRVIARDGSVRVWMYRNVLYESPSSFSFPVGKGAVLQYKSKLFIFHFIINTNPNKRKTLVPKFPFRGTGDCYRML